MITVEVRLYATLRKYQPEAELGEGVAFDLAEGTTVGEVVDRELGIPPREVKVIFVNGVSRKPDHLLADGDRVAIFPPVGGG